MGVIPKWQFRYRFDPYRFRWKFVLLPLFFRGDVYFYTSLDENMMHRTQIYLQDDLYEQLKRRSLAWNISISELIRRSVVKDLLNTPIDEARLFFEQLVPLESFADVEPESFVRELRDKSRLLREKNDQPT